eukprot:GHVN01039258.1.p1 GENE.GHVN01039258.1~~GHVN01039258.1.p1  ORF type:complete len:156 (-),score=27.92 GHVN01039258.1:259-726(-)
MEQVRKAKKLGWLVSKMNCHSLTLSPLSRLTTRFPTSPSGALCVRDWRDKLLWWGAVTVTLMGCCLMLLAGVTSTTQLESDGSFFHVIFPITYAVMVVVVICNWIMGCKMIWSGVSELVSPSQDPAGKTSLRSKSWQSYTTTSTHRSLHNATRLV